MSAFSDENSEWFCDSRPFDLPHHHTPYLLRDSFLELGDQIGNLSTCIVVNHGLSYVYCPGVVAAKI